MKVIIAGSREINDYELVCQIIEESKFEITEVVCGMCRGVDLLGKQWAEENGLKDKIAKFPANWTKYGIAAGPIRNGQMANYADALIVIMHVGSRGAKDMLDQAMKKRLKIYARIAYKKENRWELRDNLN